MATYGPNLRRGLPRTRGGEPWPPAGIAPVEVYELDEEFINTAERPDRQAAPEAEAAHVAAPSVPAPAPAPVPAAAPVQDAPTAEAPAAAAPAPQTSATASPAAAAAAAAAAAPAQGSTSLRRGLPRTRGGEPWPPAGSAPATGSSAPAAPVAEHVAAPAVPATPAAAPAAPASAPAAPTVALTPTAAPTPTAAAATEEGPVLRRGLPRVSGGEPWPPAGNAAIRVAAAAAPAGVAAAAAAADALPAPEIPSSLAPPASTDQGAQLVTGAAPAASADVALARPAVNGPLAWRRTVTPGKYAFEHPQPVEPRRYGKFTAGQWTGLAILGGGALLFAAGMVIALTKWFLSLPFMVEFLTRYPGTYDLPSFAQPGFPAWVQWQHFFNLFVMVLIIRSGWRVRQERRPEAFWTPKWAKTEGKGKISLTLWFHQSLDILWLANGVVFVVLLFVSGHWVRVVPTSWEVFPNALSAVLQYMSLDWPVEHGWVNYNSIQQLMYFITIFIAAPLAAITGVRMSGLWPKDAAALNKAYPVEVARAIHFPVMLYFVIFIIIHVTLVFATGALRNLNHMFGGTDAENWAGFWIMCGGLALIIAAWIAARPLVLAPIARLSGKVSTR